MLHLVGNHLDKVFHDKAKIFIKKTVTKNLIITFSNYEASDTVKSLVKHYYLGCLTTDSP